MTPLPSQRTPYPLVVSFLALATAIAALAYRYQAAQHEAVTREFRNQLVALADAKVKHVTAWRSAKLGEARSLLANPYVVSDLERLTAGRATAFDQAEFARWADALCRELHYAGVTLTDPAGRVAAYRGRVFGDVRHLGSLAPSTVAATDVTLTDFRLEEGGAPPHLGLNLPLRRSAGEPAFGALLIGLDPEDELFPLLQRWPLASRTGEALLVRRDGNDVLLLSPVRKRGQGGTSLRIPMARARDAAVRAVEDGPGVFEAEDYHGDRVFAAVSEIPGTPWRLVAKMDSEEMLAPLRRESQRSGAFAVSLIIGAAAIVFALWRRNELRSYRARYESELARRQAAERFDLERKAMDEELRRAMLALQASESRLRAAFEQAAVGMNELSLDCRFVSVNQRFCDITGYSREELIGRTFEGLTHPDDRAADAEHVGSVLRGEQIHRRWEKRYVRKDGSIIWVAVTASLVRDASGQPSNLLGVVEEITAAVAAREQLQQSEERFRHVVEHAPEGIVVVTGERAAYLNPAAVHMFGAASAAEIAGASLVDRIDPEFRAFTRDRLAAVARGTPVPAAEQNFVRMNGEVFPVESSATPIVYDGKPSALLFFRDLTEHRRAEEERTRLEQRLRQAQKMEIVGRLAGGVAHDFNNHLTVINGYCDMLLDALSPEDPLGEELSEIRAAGDRAAVLTQQLLAFSRKQVVEPKPVLLNEVVEEYCKMLRRLIGENIEVSVRLDPQLGTTLADRGQLHQVLMNIALNARDAMPDGGAITFSTANVQVEDADSEPDAKPGSYVVLSISDTGTGMSPETIQKVFEPFFTTKPVGIGTGLGLATVYGIVEQAGGFIRVESELGAGTTFCIYLPRIAAEPDRGVQAAPATRAAVHGVETVLLVEDQPEVRKLAAGVLRKAGYSVIEASTGQEALDTARRFAGRIDLLLTDVVMPGMTGRELAGTLQQERPGIHVLYMSGYSGDVLAKDGVVAYLRKPFAPAELAVKVREVLGRTAARRILVIDDEPAIRDVLRGFLEDAGYQVRTAADGEAGLRAFESAAFDLVITDLVMPRKEGIEVLRELNERFAGTPVIVISGAFDGEFLKAASLLGARATFVKPVAGDRLLPAVRELIG